MPSAQHPRHSSIGMSCPFPAPHDPDLSPLSQILTVNDLLPLGLPVPAQGFKSSSGVSFRIAIFFTGETPRLGSVTVLQALLKRWDVFVKLLNAQYLSFCVIHRAGHEDLSCFRQ